MIEAPCPALAGLKRDLRFATTRPVDETCRRAQVVSLKSSRYGECARWSIFMKRREETEKVAGKLALDLHLVSS